MKRIVLLTALLLAAALPAAAQMNYQGRLTDASGNPLADGQQTLEFSVWTAAAGGDQVWGPYTLDGSAGKPKADLVSGRFNVVLGATDATNRQLKDSFAGPRFIQIKVGGNAAIAPRQQILAAPTALHAQKADTVNDGAIGTPQLANLAVTGDKIANNTIPVSKLTGAGANFWDGNGTNVWRTGGNVGIGTAIPAASAKLDVSGGYTLLNGLRISGLDTGNTIYQATGDIGINTAQPSQSVKIGSFAGGTALTVTGGNAQVSGNLSVTGAINGEEPPHVFEIYDAPNINTWRWVLVDTGKWSNDIDGCRMKFNFLNHQTKEVRCITEEIYIESDARFLISSPGYKGFCKQENVDHSFVLGSTTKNDIVPAPWGWIWVRNYKSPEINGGVAGPAFLGGDRYKMYFMVPPQISVTVIIYDR